MDRNADIPRARGAFAFGATLAALLLIDAQTGAEAAWCAMYRNGGTNCSFATHAQCLTAISGVGGTCNQDPASATVTTEPERSRPERARPERRKREAAPRRPEPARTAPAEPAPPAAPVSAPPAAAAPASSQPQMDFAGARTLVLQGQYEAGLRALRALNFDDHPDVAAFVGLAHRKLNRLDEARAWYDRALAYNPNHRLALSFYGMLYAETGDVVRARVQLDKIKLACGGTDCNEHRALEAVIAAAAR